jgi:hypothetical protein
VVSGGLNISTFQATLVLETEGQFRPFLRWKRLNLAAAGGRGVLWGVDPGASIASEMAKAKLAGDLGVKV